MTGAKLLNSANTRRALRIEGVMDIEYNSNNRYTEVVRDVLTDLRHFCDLNEIDFDQALSMSEIHYNEEVNNDVESI